MSGWRPKRTIVSLKQKTSPPSSAVFFICKGCGAVAGHFPEEFGSIPAGATVHCKPVEHINRVPVLCELFQQLEPDEFWELHRDAQRAELPSWIQEFSN
jgi:hypothetical protein